MEYTVLIVDDDTNLLDGLRRSLHNSGFNIRCAANADDALRMMRTTAVHLVISDQVMGGMSGAEFLQMVHRLYPNTSRFLLTGHATAEMVVNAINHQGLDRVYLKPCKATDLEKGIKETLQRQALATEALRIIEENRLEGAKIEKQNEAKPGRRTERRTERPMERENVSNLASRAETREVVMESAPFGWDTLIRRLESLSAGRK